MGKSVDRSRLLKDLGYGHPRAEAAALDALVAADLTNPRKQGIAAAKRERVREVLERALLRVCARCEAEATGDGRVRVPAESARHCDLCGGSDNRIAVREAAEACRRAGVERVAVIGGSPASHEALRGLWPDGVELRIVPGTDRHTAAQARANLAWADVVLVWGSTQLDHKVSLLYTRTNEKKVVTAKRRSIRALAERLADHLKSRGPR